MIIYVYIYRHDNMIMYMIIPRHYVYDHMI